MPVHPEKYGSLLVPDVPDVSFPFRQAKEEAERMLQESNARIENTIRTIKEAQAEKEKTRQARQELTNFRTSLDALASKEHEEKIAQKMKKLKEKQERKKNKKNEPKAAVSSPSSAPKVVPGVSFPFQLVLP